jgi:hypothetical protein
VPRARLAGEDSEPKGTICSRDVIDLSKEGPPYTWIDGPYFHADTGQADVVYLDNVDSGSPHAFFAVMAELRKFGLPVWAHFANPRAKLIAERRYRAEPSDAARALSEPRSVSEALAASG